MIRVRLEVRLVVDGGYCTFTRETGLTRVPCIGETISSRPEWKGVVMDVDHCVGGEVSAIVKMNTYPFFTDPEDKGLVRFREDGWQKN
jgi:hypothetical protein